MQKYTDNLRPVAVQETQEILGLLSEAVSELATSRKRTSESMLLMVRDELYALLADIRYERDNKE